MTPMSKEKRPGVDYEKSDIDLRKVMRILGGLVIAGATVYALCLAIIVFTKPTWRAGKKVTEPVHAVPPEPRLQANPSEDLAAMKAEEDAILDHTGWVNREQGIVHIPIEEAIDRTLRRGLPSRTAHSTEATR